MNKIPVSGDSIAFITYPRDLITPDPGVEAAIDRANQLRDTDLMPVIVSQNITLQSIDAFLLKSNDCLHHVAHRHQAYQ